MACNILIIGSLTSCAYITFALLTKGIKSCMLLFALLQLNNVLDVA